MPREKDKKKEEAPVEENPNLIDKTGSIKVEEK